MSALSPPLIPKSPEEPCLALAAADGLRAAGAGLEALAGALVLLGRLGVERVGDALAADVGVSAAEEVVAARARRQVAGLDVGAARVLGRGLGLGGAGPGRVEPRGAGRVEGGAPGVDDDVGGLGLGGGGGEAGGGEEGEEGELHLGGLLFLVVVGFMDLFVWWSESK